MREKQRVKGVYEVKLGWYGHHCYSYWTGEHWGYMIDMRDDTPAAAYRAHVNSPDTKFKASTVTMFKMVLPISPPAKGPKAKMPQSKRQRKLLIV